MNLFKSLSLKIKLLLTVALACVICGAVSVGVAIHYNNTEFHRGLVEKARIVHGRLDIAAKYVAEQGGLKPMIERYTQKYTDSSQLTDDDKKVILQQVPIYAAMKIGSEASDKDLFRFRVFSNEPRNKNNAATPEELEVFKQFESDPNLKEIVADGDKFVTVYRPIFISESRGCLTCHGDPGHSPWKNGKDILGIKMEDWKDGKLHGVFAVTSDVTAVHKANSDKGITSSTTMLAVFITIGGLIALLLAAFVIKGPIDALSNVANLLAQTGDQVTSAATHIAASSQELSQATTEQAASLEETAASLEEISSMINKATDGANASAISSTESQQKATEGRAAVDQMLTSMNEISKSNEDIMSQVSQSNQQMTEIIKVIQEIGNKTKVINEIVFQTKLLSFNASVEAARAGEHGKGFAVVAEEVGNLAQMSGNAAKEITEMLEGSVAKVENIVQATKAGVESLVQQGKQKVESGVNTAQQCSEVLNEIVINVTKVSGLAQEISNASKEQSQGVGEINKAMAQLDTVTQQNASTSGETASAAQELSAQAESLKRAVSNLVATIQGGSVEHYEHRPTPAGSAKVVKFSAKQKPAVVAPRPLKKPSVSHSSEEFLLAAGDSVIPSGDDDGFKE